MCEARQSKQPRRGPGVRFSGSLASDRRTQSSAFPFDADHSDFWRKSVRNSQGLRVREAGTYFCGSRSKGRLDLENAHPEISPEGAQHTNSVDRHETNAVRTLARDDGSSQFIR